jgi:hypothetical protein
MTLTLLVIAIAIICAIVVTWAKRSKSQSELDRHSISVEQLQSMMVYGPEVLLFDVRQPQGVLWLRQSRLGGLARFAGEPFRGPAGRRRL